MCKPPADIVVYLQSAFIKALSEESTTLDGANISVAAGKYYVVPVGKKMGDSENNTLAGQIYSLGKVFKFSVSNTKKVVFSPGNLQYNTANGGSYQFAEHQWDYIGKTDDNRYCTGVFDLFCWGTGNNPGERFVSLKAANFTDWGDFIESDKHWYTLTKDECTERIKIRLSWRWLVREVQ